MREHGHGGLSLLRWRARLNRCVRRFFEEAGFVEVETPLLTPSPELWMKRRGATGMPRVYQLAHCFRNVEEQGPFHRHEFTMLEWYAAGESYHDALARTDQLLAALHAEVEVLGVRGAPATRPPLQQVSMARLWQDELGLDPAQASVAALRAVARRLELPAAAGDTWEQLFNRIFLTCIEPRIARDRPVAVLDYPARIPTLAATHADGVHAMRWELYLRRRPTSRWKGFEGRPAWSATSVILLGGSLTGFEFCYHVSGSRNPPEHPRVHEQRLVVGALGKGAAAIFGDQRVVAQLRCHPRRAEDAHVGQDTGDDHTGDAHVTEGVVENGVVKGARGELVDYQFVPGRKNLPGNFVGRGAAVALGRAVRSARLAVFEPGRHLIAVRRDRTVSRVKHPHPVLPKIRQKPLNPGQDRAGNARIPVLDDVRILSSVLGVGILHQVARLHVHDQQRRRIRIEVERRGVVVKRPLRVVFLRYPTQCLASVSQREQRG